MSRQLDNRHSGNFKVVSVTPNVNNGTVTETMTNTNGEVLIRVGGGEPVQNNGVYDPFDAHHVLYTKHSSATIYKSESDTSAQSVKTRQIIKIRENGTATEKSLKDMDAQNNNTFERASHVLTFSRPSAKDACFYCKKTVYQKEKIGPIKDVLFHKHCFHCAVCKSMLTLKNFYQNPNDPEDRRVYCTSHQPAPAYSKGHIDDKQIKDFINKPKPEPVNINIRGGPDAGKIHSIGADSLHIRGAMHVPRLDTYNQTVRVEPLAQTGSHVDNTTVGIKTAMNAPRLDNYNQTVRPVPPLAHVPMVDVSIRDPDHYKSRQVQHQISIPTPPVSPQQVRFHPEPQMSPVSPSAYFPTVDVSIRDPDNYKKRQVQHQVSIPSSPVSPQQVRFNTETQMHYYNGYR